MDEWVVEINEAQKWMKREWNGGECKQMKQEWMNKWQMNKWMDGWKEEEWMRGEEEREWRMRNGRDGRKWDEWMEWGNERNERVEQSPSRVWMSPSLECRLPSSNEPVECTRNGGMRNVTPAKMEGGMMDLVITQVRIRGMNGQRNEWKTKWNEWIKWMISNEWMKSSMNGWK